MRKIKELVIEKSLFSSALVTIAVTVGIILVLAVEAIRFFNEVSIFDFFTDKTIIDKVEVVPLCIKDVGKIEKKKISEFFRY